jgi:hypothetical protein
LVVGLSRLQNGEIMEKWGHRVEQVNSSK